MSSVAAPCFTVIDSCAGLFGLRKRSPTLDGAVPLRAAQACMPLLAGNALGFQVVLNQPLRLRRRLGGFVLHGTEKGSAELLAAQQQRGLERLVAHGHIESSGRWYKHLSQGPVWSDRGLIGNRAPRLWVWTGLLLKPDRGVWLRVLSAANRRFTNLEVAEFVIADDPTFIPLVLELTLTTSPPRELELSGELACVVPFAPGVTFTSRQIEDEPTVGQAHASFYDASYFAQKKKGTTRRYRRLIDTRQESENAGCPIDHSLFAASTNDKKTDDSANGIPCQVIAAGEGSFTIQDRTRFASATDPVPSIRPTEKRRTDIVEFYNLLAFGIFYDGYSLRLEYAQTVLQKKAQALWLRWRALYGDEFVDSHHGALWYLSRYFTKHPPGEPYFFVKPWAFVRTPPGWSCIVEGAHAAGYDVLRGVVATDQFFALPGVFSVHQQHRELKVAADAPILRALPIPRRLLHAGYRVAQLGEGD